MRQIFEKDLVMLVSFFKQLFLRSREAVFWLALFPTVLFLILVSIFGNIEENIVLRIRVIGQSETLRKAFEGVELVEAKFESAENRAKLLAELESDDIDVVVEIPKDFDTLYARSLLLKRTKLFKPVDVTVHYVPVRENSKLAFEVVRSVFEALDLPKMVDVEVHDLSNTKFDYESFILAGVVGMALLSTFLFGFMNDMIWLRRGKRLRSFLVRPVSMLKVYTLAMVVNLVALVIGLSILLIVAKLSGVDTMSYLPTLVANCALSVVVLTSLTLAVATLSRKVTALVIFQQVFFQVQMFLGGYYFPIRQMPQFLQVLAKLLPLTHPIDAMRVHLGFNSIEGNHYLVPALYILGSVVLIFLRRETFYRAEED